VVDEKQGYTHHFSYGCIVQIVESDGGVDVGGFMMHKHFSVAIKVGHLMPLGPGY
jgi:ribosomal protein S6E (S10)